MKILSLLILMMISSLSLAHSGHSDTNIAVHDYEHMLWTVSGVALLISIVGIWVLKKR